MEVSRLVTVTDDWHPCYPDNKIVLRLSLPEKPFRGYYVLKLTAWGMDDYGMDFEVRAKDWEEALQTYDRLLVFYNGVPENIDQEWFLEKGFEYF